MSKGAKGVVTWGDESGDRSASADVCVIGSGAGGAVAAAELAAGGLSVVLLEQGHHWTREDFTQREDQMLPRLFEEAGMRQTTDGGITILQGRAVGGSTVHNLCYAFRPPDPILRMWRDEHGLSDLTPEALAPSIARVEKNLHVQQIREDEVNELNRRIRAGAEALGYAGFVTRHNRKNCVKAGYCLLGCSYDAKQSMLLTYVPRAAAAGARVFANAEVERIEADAGRARRVLGRVVTPDGETRGSFEVSARAVVLSAGAVASPALLLRSGLVDADGPTGRHLHLHPSVMVAGFFDDDIHAYRGIPQSYYIDEFLDLDAEPHRGYVLMPITAFPILTAANLPGFGRQHYSVMRDYAKMGGLLVLLHDESEGRVHGGGSAERPKIEYALTPRERESLARGLEHCAEVLFAGGARRVVVPYAPDPVIYERGQDLSPIGRRPIREGDVPIASTHPQSTCRMGADPRTSVVDGVGRVHGVEGLYVADMSVFPTSLGVPPQITTAALADRTAHHILANWPELAA